MSVYKAINLVQADLAKVGMAKSQKNEFDGYAFRGIDDVYNALAPVLAKHGLCILPRMVSRVCVERQNLKGGLMSCVTVEAEFDFVCAEDGTKHTVKTYGEGMDRADKATNKAMSAAYKYACFQTFVIPIEGEDADAESPVANLKIRPSDGAWESLDESTQAKLADLASKCIKFVAMGNAADAVTALDDAKLDADSKVALWSRMDSKTRSAIKKVNEERKAA
jgi:hypothetical protein